MQAWPLLLAGGPNGLRNPLLDELVAGGSRTVTVNPYGETTATFSPALALDVGQTYYLQVIHTPGGNGSFLVYHSLYDDYASGQSQLNWGGWGNADLNGHYIGSTPVPRTSIPRRPSRRSAPP